MNEVSTADRPPRVWSVALALALVVLMPCVILVPVLFLGVAMGSLSELQALLERPIVIVLAAPLAHLYLLAVAVAGAKLSPEPFRQRLGLGPGRLSVTTCVLVALGTPALAFPLEYVLNELVGGPGAQLTSIAEGIAAHPLLALLLFTVPPGICEEVFFRGYAQQRLQRRLPAVLAIAIPALVFGAVHMDRLQSPVAALLGAWAGFLAWRAGSIRVAILVHFVINFVGTGLAIAVGPHAFFVAERTVGTIEIAVVAGSALCLVAGLVRLVRVDPREINPTPTATVPD